MVRKAVPANKPPSASARPVGHVDIYGLYDPITKKIRYVGKANCAHNRFVRHMREKRRSHYPLYAWINKLRASGHKPVMKIIASVPYEQWKDAEQTTIEFFRESGDMLLNVAAGGDEPFCPREVRVANGHKTVMIRNKDKMTLAIILNEYVKIGGVPERIKNKIKSNPKLFEMFGRYA